MPTLQTDYLSAYRSLKLGRDAKGVLVGARQSDLSIWEYMRRRFRCVHCGAQFNPKCRNRYRYHFDCNQPAPNVS